MSIGKYKGKEVEKMTKKELLKLLELFVEENALLRVARVTPGEKQLQAINAVINEV